MIGPGVGSGMERVEGNTPDQVVRRPEVRVKVDVEDEAARFVESAGRYMVVEDMALVQRCIGGIPSPLAEAEAAVAAVVEEHQVKRLDVRSSLVYRP